MLTLFLDVQNEGIEEDPSVYVDCHPRSLR